MNKVATFLIVVVLVARGAMYIYDHNKSKIDKLVSPEKTPSEQIIETPVEPDPLVKINAGSSPTVTFILTGNNGVYYYTGSFKQILQKINSDKVAELVKQYKDNTDAGELMFIIKSAEGSTYGNTLNILEAMSANEIPADHYDEAKVTEAEMKVVNIYKGN